MTTSMRWSDLDTGAKRRIVVWGSVLGALRVAALWDVHRRAADKVRGSKWLWTALLVTFLQVPPGANDHYGGKLLRTALFVVSLGIPIAYGVAGRKA
jgi:hypothetical protein